jgi:hypothetical protein
LIHTSSLYYRDWQYFRKRSNELVVNNHVYSFDYQQFQIDIIGSPHEDFEISRHYFAWNDLGNIIGRLYHKMGFKYGHNGLSLIVREGQYIMGEISLSKEINTILAFAELSPERFAQGFDTLEDIFLFAASSPYFNKQIYLLDNRNHASRIRDKKRATYNSLLKWLETQESLNAYPWDSMREQGGRQITTSFLQKAFTWFPHAQPLYEQLQTDYALKNRIKEKFSGSLIMELTGLDGKVLGHFMTYLREQGAKEWSDFTKWLDQSTPETISAWVLEQFETYKTTTSIV